MAVSAARNVFELLLMLAMPVIGGSELLDFVSTAEYWSAKGMPVSVQSMTAELSVGRAADISQLIEDLGSDSFHVREAATRAIRAKGPLVIPQLEAAAKSNDPEVAYRAKMLLRNLGHGKTAGAARKLMAIRALGELRQPAALAPLEKMLDSEEPFVAEYARRAVASIRGEPQPRGGASPEQRDEDLWLLPGRCGVVAQASPNSRIPFRLERLLEVLGPRVSVEKKGEAILRMKKSLYRLIDQLGNVRIDSTTLAVSDDIGGRGGFAMLVFRGRYDKDAAGAMLKSLGMSSRTVAGRDVFAAEDEMQFLLASDRRMIAFVGDRSDALPIRETIEALKAGKGKLASSGEMAALVKSVDRTKDVWLAAKITKAYKEVPVFAGLDSVVLEAEQKGNVVTGKLTAKGSDAKKLDQSLAVFDEGLKEILKEGKEETERNPAVKPLIDFLETVRRERDGNTVTVTATFQDAAGAMMFPLAMFALQGF